MTSPRILFEGDPTEAYKYVGVAKEFGRSTFGAGILSKVWRLGEDVQIRVMNNLQARVCKVWIRAGGGDFYYQFLGTEGWVYQDYPDPNVLGRKLVRGNACWVKIVRRVVDGIPRLEFKAKPLVSSLRESSEDPPKWHYIENPYLTDDYLKITPAHQPDGSDFTKWYTDDGQRLVGTTWAQAKPHYAVGAVSGGVNASFDVFDSGYDFAPNVFKTPKATTQAPDSDWYREAAIQVVVDERYGKRAFLVMVDVNHDFYCYPLGAQEARYDNPDSDIKHNVPPDLIKRVACPWPGWVSQDRIGKAAGGDPEDREFRFRWAFNTLGTHAACVAYHRDAAWGGSRTMDDETPIQEDYPGIVEVRFDIALRGTEPKNFSFSVERVYALYSKEVPLIPIAVGYLNKNIYDGDILKYSKNVLIVLSYEHYLGYLTIPSSTGIRRPVFATVAKVSYRNESAEFNLIREWLACYDNSTPNCALNPVFGEPYADYTNTRTGYAERPFYPLGEDIPGKPEGEGCAYDSQVFVTQLASMDLGTLSFSLCSSLTHIAANNRDLGSYFDYGDGNPIVVWGQSGILATVIIYDEQRHQEFVGAANLETIMRDLYQITGDFPDFAEMNQFTMSATLDYNGWGPHYTGEYWTTAYTADITYHLGEGLSSFTLSGITNAMATLYDYRRIWDLGPFGFELPEHTGVSDANVVLCPMVYFYFDEPLLFRPGWVTSDHRSSLFWSGSANISAYPFGAIRHHRVLNMTSTALTNIRGRLNVHPSGSYSIFAGPYAAGEGIFITDYSPLSVTIPEYQQVTIDCIYARKNAKKLHSDDPDVLDAEGSTTHLAVMNECFGLGLTAEDYYLALTRVGNEFRFTPQYNDGTPLPYYEQNTNVPLAAILTNSYTKAPLSLGAMGHLATWQVTENCFHPMFMAGQRYELAPVSFVPTNCFPNPRIESVFFNPGGNQ